ncbi:MAG TPA: DUF2283 domain-containing protein [Thermomicrobiales bacterium]|nr:DUF2283 domain-containing protein [Thermomicrobiales bacterium]
MQFCLDPDANALSIEIQPGRIARTIELSGSVYVDVDVDAEGAPLGIEIVNADEFVPFLRAHADDAAFPMQIRAWVGRPAPDRQETVRDGPGSTGA